MKRKFALFSLLTAVLCGVLTSPVWADVGITSTNFPDSNFRAYITETLDADGNGSLSDAEIADAKHINVSGMDIANLTGIEHLTVLRQLDCSSNALTALDVSTLAQLTILDCHNNLLTALDVTDCSRLSSLYCYDNLLENLDVAGCAALEYLSCRDNRLETLDMSGCTALNFLYCYNNSLTRLSNLADCVNLKTLSCRGNLLTALDMASDHPKLETLYISQTIPGLADATATGDATYPYQLDLDNNAGVQVTNLSGIVSVDGYSDSTKIETTYDASTGVIRFKSQPTSVQYLYDTGCTHETTHVYMPVTLTGKPVINTEELPVGYVGKSYRYYLNGAAASTIHWSWSGMPSLPDGLGVYEYVGSIHGTPETGTEGTYNITLTATAGTQSTSKTLPLVIKPASEAPARPTITTTTSSLPAATKGTPYTATLEATGTTPINWYLYSGSLPDGLTLSTAGVISGTPETVETARFVVAASNDIGESTRSLRLTVNLSESVIAPEITTTTADLPYGTVGVPYTAILAATGTTPITWEWSGGTLPEGLTISTAGLISGTPKEAGSRSFSVKATNEAGNNRKTLRIAIYKQGETPSSDTPSSNIPSSSKSTSSGSSGGGGCSAGFGALGLLSVAVFFKKSSRRK